jgi:hypothetical protein
MPTATNATMSITADMRRGILFERADA